MTRSSSSSLTMMPGTFVQNAGALPMGSKSHFFLPPQTPSASSSIHMTRSTGSMMSTSSDRPTLVGRKRSRQDYTADSELTPRFKGEDDALDESMSQSELMDPGSPVPFVNTRYQIRGGLDTPSLAQAALGEESEYPDINYRRRVSATKQDDLNYFPRTPSSQLADMNDRSRISSNSPHIDVLGRALGVVGEVASKVWNFCTAGAFRGFYAGGGEGYNLASEITSEPSNSIPAGGDSFWQRNTPQESKFHHRESTPVPGSFPTEEYSYPYVESRDSTPPRSNKRRITSMVSNNTDDLVRNWVMVGRNGYSAAKQKTPSSIPRPSVPYSMPTNSSASRQPAASTRPVSRASTAGTGLRRPGLVSSRSTVSHAGSPGLNSATRASAASTRSPAGLKRARSAQVSTPVRQSSGLNGDSTSTPLSKEAQQWMDKLKKEEAEADESMARFNKQLKAMIKEGKEALGTRIEVDVDVDEDMGLVDGFETVGTWK